MDRGESPLTNHQATYYAHLLTRRGGEGVERLSQSLFDASVDLNPHQIEAAAFALHNPLSNGVLLSDEVGLGKTIEAGLVLCQLWAEGKRRLLVICPASLRKQWAAEIEEKFHLPVKILDTKVYNEVARSGVANPFLDSAIVVASYQFAASHSADLAATRWDIVIIDEAHKLRNAYRRSNKLGRVIRATLGETRKLLLTATPLQNSIMELYGLMTFVDDHLFGEPAHFRSVFGSGEAPLSELRERLKPYYVRTLRRDVLEYIRYTERRAITRPFSPADEEQDLYETLNLYLQRNDTYAFPPEHRHLSILIIRKLLASSSSALVATLEMIAGRLERLLAKSTSTGASSREDFLKAVEVDNDLLEEILEDIEEEGDVAQESEEIADLKLDPTEIRREIDEVRHFIAQARSIRIDEKTRALFSALEVGFAELEKMGAARKAVIFTESRRTQEYLRGILEANGYAGQIVLFNGTNSDPASRVVYERWNAENEPRGRTSGSRAIDMRTALIEHFRDHASIMIATEAGAEGVNLQFCSLVINYDLPWNPQRIEQRVGRCHRYGQKFDIVVINFLNTRNAADQRVLELLDEKFQLFRGVFGASDEILGTIESGVDFERRILEIYQSCRTPGEIEAAFALLRSQLDEKISTRLQETRRVLLEQFDEDVHRRLRVNLENARIQIRDFERALWLITQHVLAEKAHFDPRNYSFDLLDSPLVDAPPGRYFLVSQNRDGSATQSLYRLTHPLAEYVIREAKQLHCPSVCLRFDLTNHEKRISILDPLVGKRGALIVEQVAIQAGEREEYVVCSGTVATEASLTPEVAERLLSLEGRIAGEVGLDPLTWERAEHESERHVQSVVSASVERSSARFQEEREKLFRWADEMIASVESELSSIKARIRALERESRLAQTVDQQREYEEQVKRLNDLKRRKRTELFAVEDEIEGKRDGLITALELRCRQQVERKRLFAVEWKVV